MLVYRIGRTIHAGDLSGRGAELHGGRWNIKDIPCIYTAGTKALCILEYAANVRLNELPGDLSMTTFMIPDDGWITVAPDKLPRRWQQRPFPEETAVFGSALLLKNEFLVIRIPSVIVPDEFNYLLNPRHPRFPQVKIAAVQRWDFDARIKQ